MLHATDAVDAALPPHYLLHLFCAFALGHWVPLPLEVTCPVEAAAVVVPSLRPIATIVEAGHRFDWGADLGAFWSDSTAEHAHASTEKQELLNAVNDEQPADNNH